MVDSLVIVIVVGLVVIAVDLLVVIVIVLDCMAGDCNGSFWRTVTVGSNRCCS